jgi:hypothetical protein
LKKRFGSWTKIPRPCFFGGKKRPIGTVSIPLVRFRNPHLGTHPDFPNSFGRFFQFREVLSANYFGPTAFAEVSDGKRHPCTRKSVLMLAAVAILVAAMMAAMAMPALAAKPAPTKEECGGTLVAIQHGEKLTGQQRQLVREFPTFDACIGASSG